MFGAPPILATPRTHVIGSVAVTVILALAVSACGGSSAKNGAGGLSSKGAGASNGIAGKSPDAIVAAATRAVKTLAAVHVSGSIVDNGIPVKLDLSLVRGQGGEGAMSENGLGFQLISVDHLLYIKGSSAFWAHFGGASAVKLFRGKWLKAPAGGQFASLRSLTTIEQLFGQLLASHGKLAHGRTASVGGQPAVGVVDRTQGGTLYVATTGPPYPLEIVKKGTSGGQVVFDRFNQPVRLRAPASAIDLAKFH